MGCDSCYNHSGKDILMTPFQIIILLIIIPICVWAIYQWWIFHYCWSKPTYKPIKETVITSVIVIPLVFFIAWLSKTEWLFTKLW